ncbi:uncharacterized protein V6R79_017789 [Siganus canaliculatus]
MERDDRNGKRKREPEEEEEGPSKKAKCSVSVSSSSSEAAGTTSALTLTSTSTASCKRSHEDDDEDDHMTRKKVAVKYIQQVDVERTVVFEDGAVKSVPLEVTFLQQLQSVPGVIRLLDWYDCPDQLILVLERPDPCVDLEEFVRDNNGSLQECDAKIIVEQLVDALIQIHAQGVFHRDIKLPNLLIETGSGIPRVRVIDFGCGTFVRKSNYMGGLGTYQCRSPEWLLTNRYKAEPVSVWQVGMTLFRLLQGSYPRISSVIDSSIQSLVHFNSELSRGLDLLAVVYDTTKTKSCHSDLMDVSPDSISKQQSSGRL